MDLNQILLAVPHVISPSLPSHLCVRTRCQLEHKAWPCYHGAKCQPLEWRLSAFL